MLWTDERIQSAVDKDSVLINDVNPNDLIVDAILAYSLVANIRDEYEAECERLRSLLPDAETRQGIAHALAFQGDYIALFSIEDEAKMRKAIAWLDKLEGANLQQYAGILRHDPDGPTSVERVRRGRDEESEAGE